MLVQAHWAWKRAAAALVIATMAGCAAEAPPDGEPEGLGTTQHELVVCADGPTAYGIDVSYYQGTVDWELVVQDGVAFGIARINHSDFMDPQFQTNWEGMKAAGIIRGAYQYFEPGEDPLWQADVVVDAVGQLGPGDLPVTLDVETTTGASPSQVEASLTAWIDRVTEGTGKAPIIYTGKYFWNDNVQSDLFNHLPLWIAAYGPPCPDTPTAWNDWLIWQFSSTGTVSGIAGDVDLNIFKGSHEDLETFAGLVLSAEVLSVEAPAELEPGQAAEITIELQNDGGKWWSATTQVVTTEPRERDSAFADPSWLSPSEPAMVDAAVAPGEGISITFPIVAPQEEGTYVESFGLRQGPAWFADAGALGDTAIQVTIEVQASDGSPVEPTDDPPSDAGPTDPLPPHTKSDGADGGCTIGGARAAAVSWPSGPWLPGTVGACWMAWLVARRRARHGAAPEY